MHDLFTPSTERRCANPPAIFPYQPIPTIRKHSSGLPQKRRAGATENSIAWLRSRRMIACVIMTIAPLVCEIANSTVFEQAAHAQTATRAEVVDRFGKLVGAASIRFAVPAAWIDAVMQVESGGDEHAISSRGATGLMQLMPATWAELSVRYGLGLDPFDPRDNILAGTAYLKDMHDRFGSAGFIAAYHAGPARYERHLATGQPLPADTTAYVAAVTSLLTGGQAERSEFRVKRAIPWREAPLFVERADAR